MTNEAIAHLRQGLEALSAERLQGMRRGLEKESLRSRPDGMLALTPHPQALGSALTHPHILPLHDSGEAAGRLFYVMPYVDGPSLRQQLLRAGELPIADAVRILRDVADAMTHAHKRGVVHRDLKPENVMVAIDEQGAWLPVVPLLTAAPREGADVDLWMLAAAIASPVATAEAARIAYGAALGAGAIKLSAKQLMALPLPGDRAAWTESARLFREASSARNARMRDGALSAFAEASCRSHRLDLDATKRVLAFWSARAFGVRPKTTTPA